MCKKEDSLEAMKNQAVQLGGYDQESTDCELFRLVEYFKFFFDGSSSSKERRTISRMCQTASELNDLIRSSMFSSSSEQLKIKEKQFSNGDYYEGGWADGPESEGLYTWKNGSCYEGKWRAGNLDGVGQHSWPSGAIYQGEWKDGTMHGVGMFDAPNGARYQGGWVRGLKHGLGKQTFSSGDVYEGIWRQGLPDGPGCYKWYDGSQYDGEWREGRMHGQGSFAWPSGQKYDGEWKDGLQDGLGRFVEADGTKYDGLWLCGKRHGIGLVRHAAPTMRHMSTLTRSLTKTMSRRGFGSSSMRRARTSSRTIEEDDLPDGIPPLRPDLLLPTIHSMTQGSNNPDLSGSGLPGFKPLDILVPDSGSNAQQTASTPALLRVYELGIVTRETALPWEEAENIINAVQNRTKPLQGSMRASDLAKGGLKLGKAVERGHQSYNLMLALQLGLRYSVGRVSTQPSQRNVPPQDFELKVKQFFPQSGSEMTPPHSCDEFVWKDYAPMVFRKLRESFNIDAGDYMLSLCSDASLRLLNTPGKSGAFFFLSHDDKFFVKSLKKGETTLLYNILPDYYKHVSTHPHTLITRFYGLHRIILSNRRKYDFVVMGNLFNTKMLLHQKFDLKGSTLGRTAGREDLNDPHEIYKDLDLKSSFRMGDRWQERLEYQIRADTALLESCQIMDYSMLLGIHYPKRMQTESKAVSDRSTGRREPNLGTKHSSLLDHDSVVRNFAEMDSEKRFKEVFPAISELVEKMRINGQAKSDLLQLSAIHLKGGTRRSYSKRQASQSSGTDAEELALRLGQSRVQLGLNLPAKRVGIRNTQTKGGSLNAQDEAEEKSVGDEEEEDVVLYFGIIDILQNYNPAKRVEHHLKSIVHDSHSISVNHPTLYAQRFREFMSKLFV
ncbi:hypothetical protein CEUSTIGMA_g1001.t1 [Chlamydomonas eustigma]|uniref:1-phosphatidylinositol-4-phosphate 5-kinase n=1 Tax=Chlamydomonas eustigma TaxID=1157962 RepID=A0A250WSP3_9CHLO|nr:hypothetical protein CEUSTIGMA_g1001.t1 [Chlamydomonas eustigma]|eukprot:GAX73550.1 hypothetical protein CEUSTIGMA_g1001.t1 [Chlamydomonas eustigma]